ncbi:hypothetical protein EDD79_104716 [Serpentinicella alkaliphila]|uniref:4Fe-4S ferredoxin-type domain-containing protein n=1 Tax=Serpentinicella alkaliphila TaxID=1734049 RepID=A0A4R2TIV6_9FIRM|nr:hypothetical protein EDD79_104716 [Serpentinicella alkaliphila]
MIKEQLIFTVKENCIGCNKCIDGYPVIGENVANFQMG